MRGSYGNRRSTAIRSEIMELMRVPAWCCLCVPCPFTVWNKGRKRLLISNYPFCFLYIRFGSTLVVSWNLYFDLCSRSLSLSILDFSHFSSNLHIYLPCLYFSDVKEGWNKLITIFVLIIIFWSLNTECHGASAVGSEDHTDL